MENILPRREARENAFLLAFSQTFGDIPLAEALSNHAENDEEHPVDAFSRLLLNAYYDIPQRWMTRSAPICATGQWRSAPRQPDRAASGRGRDAVRRREQARRCHQ